MEYGNQEYRFVLYTVHNNRLVECVGIYPCYRSAKAVLMATSYERGYTIGFDVVIMELKGRFTPPTDLNVYYKDYKGE